MRLAEGSNICFVAPVTGKQESGNGTRTKEKCDCPANCHSDHGPHGNIKGSATKDSGALSSLLHKPFIPIFLTVCKKEALPVL